MSVSVMHPEGSLLTDVQVKAPNSSAASGGHVYEGNTRLLPWLILMAILCGFSLATSIWLMARMTVMESDMARMTVHIMSNDALLLREGLMQPGDVWRGPEGNLEYGRKERPQPRN